MLVPRFISKSMRLTPAPLSGFFKQKLGVFCLLIFIITSTYWFSMGTYAERDSRSLRKIYRYMQHKDTSHQKDMWPWLDKSGAPIYTRISDGEVYRSMPIYSNVGDFLGAAEIVQHEHFWNGWKDQYSGRGIAISIREQQFDEIIRFLRSYEKLGPNLPVQLLYTELKEPYFSYIKNEISKINVDTWFVDVSPMIKKRYTFKKFENKWLAILFRSFKEVLLLDSDVVMYQNPLKFFDTKEYINTGTLFFRDRVMPNQFFKESTARYFQDMAGNVTEVQDKQVSNAMSNFFTNKLRHQMESGLVAYNKVQHLTAILAALHLNQHSPEKNEVHGDKEWFWLAHVFLEAQTGLTANFTFHQAPASSIGKVEKVAGTNDVYQICSIQISHTGDDDELLWINGGLKVCKKHSSTYDFKRLKHLQTMYGSVENLFDYYSEALHIDGAIIPETSLQDTVTPRKGVTRENDWIQNYECANFNYCARFKSGEYGRMITFEKDTKHNDIQKAWMNKVL